MNWAKTAVDVIVAGFEIYLGMLFYGSRFKMKNIKRPILALILSAATLVCLAFVTLFQYKLILLAIYSILVFLLGFLFDTTIAARFFFALFFTALAVISEILVGFVLIWVIHLSIESINSNIIHYIAGNVTSKLFTLMIICIFRYFAKPIDRSYNYNKIFLPMSAMPALCLLMCFVTIELSTVINNTETVLICMAAFSLLFIPIVTSDYILNKLLNSYRFEQGFKHSITLLKASLEHNDGKIRANRETRAMRHDLKNELTALLGMLLKNRVDEAINRIKKLINYIDVLNSIIDTGYPAFDAVICSKINIAKRKKIKISYKPMIISQINIDQFDLAHLLGNALDNAIEAVEKNEGKKTEIFAAVTADDNYITISVENHALIAIDKKFRTTKPDKRNHGYGIQRMRILAERYDGELSIGFNEATKVFSLTAMLKNISVDI